MFIEGFLSKKEYAAKADNKLIIKLYDYPQFFLKELA